ncbi:hypothetical protein SOQ18_002686 [Enterococcus faecalis]|uniref:hypothetical protein n=1 Tax=Enterococcus faecalis TaxID=1351 RepID=UPI001881F6E1|nr:hypothetical protein [Enterococcus faecalis]EGO2803692.1 hypothetical protein [Enterococcus faecalis]EGO6149204.1 hypothetical protein [Enterococcus faecalis]EGO8150833.1 hypothetical protein [Enterococcus faecalis]EGO8322822.1 hypothetical protein [Enterococcus faecalis]EGO9169083.1 hypothetical protein [Enterococcus faecalis]
MVKSISLKKNERKKYNKLVGIIAVVFLVCFARRLFVPAVSSEQSTQIGKIIKQDTREYQLIDRAYFPKNKRLDVLFFSPINSSNVLDELFVTVKKNRTDKTRYDTKLQKITEELYLLEINNLEEKWQNLQIAIYPKGYSKDTLTNEQKFHFVHKELSDKELPAKNKSKEDYEIDFLKFQLKETRQAQEKNKKEQQRLSEDVEKLNQITNDLEDTLKDKTDSEKQVLQQTISQNKSKKEELQKTINEREKELTELNKKQKNLENRINERSKNSKE